jgi:hypothetical protein
MPVRQGAGGADGDGGRLLRVDEQQSSARRLVGTAI